MNQVTSELPESIRPSVSAAKQTVRGGVFANEDWWSVWVGLLLVVVAWALFAFGSSIKWLAVAPAKWSSVAQAGADIAAHLPNYAALFVVFAVLFGIALAVLKQRLAHFCPRF